MDQPRTIRLEILLDRRLADWGLLIFLVLASAAPLSSESLTLSTFYPSPLGVYKALISTGGSAAGNNTLLSRDFGMVGIGTNAPAYALDVQRNGSNGAGNINASGYVQAANGAAVLFGGNSAVNGLSSSGGASFYGRPRVGDWGSWLELGEPSGLGGGWELQVTGTGTAWAEGVYTATGAGLGNAPSRRNTLDDSNGEISAQGNILGGKNIYAGNFGVPGATNGGNGYIHIGQDSDCTQSSNQNGPTGCGTNQYATWFPGLWMEGKAFVPFTQIKADTTDCIYVNGDGKGAQGGATFTTDLGQAGCVPANDFIQFGSVTYWCCNR